MCFLLQRQGWNFQLYCVRYLRQCHEQLTQSVLLVVLTLSGCVDTIGHNVCEQVLLQYVSVNRRWFFNLPVLPVLNLTWDPYLLCQIYCIAIVVYIFQQCWTLHKSYMFWALLRDYIHLNNYVCVGQNEKYFEEKLWRVMAFKHET